MVRIHVGQPLLRVASFQRIGAQPARANADRNSMRFLVCCLLAFAVLIGVPLLAAALKAQ